MMHPMTVSNLQSAFAGESQAHMRYLIYADKAERDGFPNVSRLFRAIAFAEQAHASGHFRTLRDIVGGAVTTSGGGFGLGPTAANLGVAIEGEDFEVEEMYPAYINTALLQQEANAQRSMDWAFRAEQIHRDMYAAAKQAIEAGKDYQIGKISVCSNCGHTLEGDAPDRCPICNVTRERYSTFE